ncbi:MAG: SGNH/GDSL hydrolase family protein [Candidatus Dormibacteraceae bacterium]
MYLGFRPWRNSAVLLVAVFAGLLNPIAAQAASLSQTAASSYVALGDSYASGRGAPAFIRDTSPGKEDSCYRSANASYSGIYAQMIGLPDFSLGACSGATTQDVLLQSSSGVPAQIESLSASTRLVTLSIGGNDADFSEILVDCVLSLQSCEGEFPDESQLIDSLQAPLTKTYLAIKDRAPRAAVMVFTYPQIIPADRSCLTTINLGSADRIWLRERASQLNQVIRDSAARAKVGVLDEENAFAGHELCSSQPWAHGEVITDPGESFHPTITGNAKMAQDLAALTVRN